MKSSIVDLHCSSDWVSTDPEKSGNWPRRTGKISQNSQVMEKSGNLVRENHVYPV